MLENPELVLVSSTGRSAELWPKVMGVYRITNITHYDRPVWRNMDRDKFFLFYNGKQ